MQEALGVCNNYAHLSKMVEWFMYFIDLAPHHCGFDSHLRNFGFVRKLNIKQLAYGMLVVIFRSPLVHEILCTEAYLIYMVWFWKVALFRSEYKIT